MEIKQQKIDNPNIKSTQREIKRGVLQGSILGSTLFIIYLNDITNSIPNNNLTIYADDTTILNYKITNKELEVDTFVLLNSTAEYFNNIGLCINQKKTEFICFKTNHRISSVEGTNLYIDDCLLKEVTYTKFLGVIIDDFLNWNEHINNLASKLSTSLCHKNHI